ncbi:hypothetical protein T4B_15219 [Trichinella pseudospiralis]|uniref:Uncharacterized protein n=2 Tax=Trichinella pseudospiralis TaxID=6337 RepID=A0A0V1J858_TRIPS|nr:hypothetical protein T4D_10258 [Trichinella pseudospiralis]KRZ20121.1 hypothetical protein T4B_15219 [Trichinella pseudospiralis]KRZ31163.1 hypothetical protein T4C_8945 [Trichinella pseudospiralis]
MDVSALFDVKFVPYANKVHARLTEPHRQRYTDMPAACKRTPLSACEYAGISNYDQHRLKADGRKQFTKFD